MSQRTEKVSSLIQHIAAAELAKVPGTERLTVTKVDVSPDLREATVWIGVIADDSQAEEFLKPALSARRQLQDVVAKQLTTKFVPRLTIKRDVGGQYADHITKLIRGL